MVNRSKSSINYTSIQNTREYYSGFAISNSTANQDCTTLSTPTPSAFPTQRGASATKTYKFYFDIACTKDNVSKTCTSQTLNPAGIRLERWWCKNEAEPGHPAPYPNSKSLVSPDGNSNKLGDSWFTAWNCSNVNANTTGQCWWSSGCNRPLCGGKCGIHGGFNGGGSCNDANCNGWTGYSMGSNKCDGSYNIGVLNVNGSYLAYKPIQKYYYFNPCKTLGNSMTVAATPTFVQFIASNGTVDTSDTANVSPAYAVFTISYNIVYPTDVQPDSLDSMFTMIGSTSYTAWTINKNSQMIQTLLFDYCNIYNNGSYISSSLKSTGKRICNTNIMAYFTNSPTTPPSGYPTTQIPSTLTIPTTLNACDTTYSYTTGCQTGWLNYCNNQNTFNTTDCKNFYNTSRVGNVYSDDVQKLLKSNCAAAATSNGKINATISSDVQAICGCWLPDQVYNDFKNNLSKANPALATLFGQDQQCYYPMCYANTAFQPKAVLTCPSNVITTCITNTTNNLNAGGSISNVQVQNNAVQNCTGSSSTSSPSPAPANSTPISSPGGASTTGALPATPAPATTPSPATTPAPATTPSPANASAPTPASTPASTPAPEKGGLCIIL